MTVLTLVSKPGNPTLSRRWWRDIVLSQWLQKKFVLKKKSMLADKANSSLVNYVGLIRESVHNTLCVDVRLRCFPHFQSIQAH